MDEKSRKKAGKRKEGRAKSTVVVPVKVEPLPSLEDLLRDVLITVSAKEAEALSESAQKKEGVFG